MTVSKNGILSVDRTELLTFFDDPSAVAKGMPATAVNAVAGEELGLALLMRYFDDADIDATLLDCACNTGKMRGHRLDAWIRTPEILYQVEVKNWSAHSFSGTPFPLKATAAEACEHRKAIWNEYWNGSTFVDPPAAKVLEKMKPPKPEDHVEPLIVFWVSLHPEGKADPLFQVLLEDKPFACVHVFSMSTYLRTLTANRLDLKLPKTKTRLAILDRIFVRR